MQGPFTPPAAVGQYAPPGIGPPAAGGLSPVNFERLRALMAQGPPPQMPAAQAPPYPWWPGPPQAPPQPAQGGSPGWGRLPFTPTYPAGYNPDPGFAMTVEDLQRMRPAGMPAGFESSRPAPMPDMSRYFPPQPAGYQAR